MSALDDLATLVRDPQWFLHRHDETQDFFHLMRLTRADHGRATFMTAEYLPADAPVIVRPRREMMAVAAPRAPMHFILHSAFCCSSVLARAFDLPGTSMGLKEPQVFNDLVGWRRRGGDPGAVATVLDSALTLLAKPFGPGEALVVKPSNILNSLSDAVLRLRPDASALLLHAPLRTYLASIAKKEMWGRYWVRELFMGLLKEGALQRFAFDVEQYLMQTDLQIAAVGWLAQHALFADLVQAHGPRVRTLDSETLMARPADVMAALAALYRLPIDAAAIDAIVAGPAFTRHSKWGTDFDRAGRESEHRDAASLHADEIEKVAVWAETVAQGAGISLALPGALLG